MTTYHDGRTFPSEEVAREANERRIARRQAWAVFVLLLIAMLVIGMIEPSPGNGQVVQTPEERIAELEAQVSTLTTQAETLTAERDTATALANDLRSTVNVYVVLLRQAQREKALMRRNYRRVLLARKSVRRAIKIASITYGVPEWQLRRVAFCESTFNPNARSPWSTAKGLFQFLDSTWRRYPYGRAGLSVYDPYANAMQAAYVVRLDGGWRQWVCQP